MTAEREAEERLVIATMREIAQAEIGNAGDAATLTAFAQEYLALKKAAERAPQHHTLPDIHPGDTIVDFHTGAPVLVVTEVQTMTMPEEDRRPKKFFIAITGREP